MKEGPSISVQSAAEQNLMIQIWNSGIVRNAVGIMNIVRIIFSRMSMLNKQII